LIQHAIRFIQDALRFIQQAFGFTEQPFRIVRHAFRFTPAAIPASCSIHRLVTLVAGGLCAHACGLYWPLRFFPSYKTLRSELPREEKV